MKLSFEKCLGGRKLINHANYVALKNAFENMQYYIVVFPNETAGLIQKEHAFIGKRWDVYFNYVTNKTNLSKYEVVEVDNFNRTAWVEFVK